MNVPAERAHPEPTSALEAALAYARRGWPVFPLHAVDAEGRCTCAKAGCPSPGKHPRTRRGLHDATTEEGQLRAWWAGWPEANVAIVTGRVSDLLVLDIDPRHDGEESLQKLQELCGGVLPVTVESLTGGGGRHLFFQHPDQEIRCAVEVGGLAGIDLRADRGYVVAPPSVHASGRRYEWEASSNPDDVPLAMLPAELLALVVRESPGGNGKARRKWQPEEPVREGARNKFLTSEAGRLRRRGLDQSTILSTLSEVNGKRCAPPLPRSEVESIATSVSRYDPAVQPPDGPQATNAEIHLTDLGNARRLARDHASGLRYCHPWQTWMVWDGCRWVRDRSGEAVRRAETTVRAIYAEALGQDDSDARRTVAKHAMKSESQRAIAAMLELAKADQRIVVLPEDFDRDDTRHLLNVLNGTIDLRTGELLPHRREELITKLAPVTYDPTARCPLWEGFLTRVLPDTEVRAFLQRFAGYALTGDTSEQVFSLLYGTGANGKSTFLETLKAMLGDYAYKTDFETFLERKNAKSNKGGPRQDLIELAGRRLVIAVEASEGRQLDANTIKEVTGGDTLTARGMYHRDQTSFRPQAKLLLATNHRPEIRDATEAIWRRVIEVPFDVTIPATERDADLPQHLREPAELSGILNWAIAGCLAWQRCEASPRLRPPEAVRRATTSYREDQDAIAPFLAARSIPDTRGRVTNKELRSAYLTWCQESEEDPMSERAFSRALEEHGFKRQRGKDKQRTRGWAGIRLADMFDHPTSDGSDG